MHSHDRISRHRRQTRQLAKAGSLIPGDLRSRGLAYGAIVARQGYGDIHRGLQFRRRHEDGLIQWRVVQSMKTFDNEWIVQAFEDHPSFFTKRMFGGLAVYLYGRQMMVLVEPTKTGRWQWHGVLVCTDHAHHPAIVEEFPQLSPHDILKKWLYIDSRHAAFEPTLERVAEAIARDDPRFGIHPRPRKDRVFRRRRL